MPTVSARLAALENRPGNRIPRFSVELADGGTVTAFGYGLLAMRSVSRVCYDPMNSCADTVIGLFIALHPEAEVVANAQP